MMTEELEELEELEHFESHVLKAEVHSLPTLQVKDECRQLSQLPAEDCRQPESVPAATKDACQSDALPIQPDQNQSIIGWQSAFQQPHQSGGNWTFLAALTLVSLVLSVAFCSFNQLGFDWGYLAVQGICGQLAGERANQGMTAIWAAPTIVFPLMLALSLAFCRATISGAYPWRAVLVFVIASVTGLFLGDFDAGKIIQIENLSKVLPAMALSIAWGLVCFQVAYRKLDHLSKRTCVGLDDLKRASRSSLIYLAPAFVYGILNACNLVGTWQSAGQEAGVFALLVFASCATAVPRVRHTFDVAIRLSFVPVMPVILAALTNVCLNLASLALDTVHMGAGLGWRALLSAVMITAVSVLAAGAGTIFGRTLAMSKARRKLGI